MREHASSIGRAVAAGGLALAAACGAPPAAPAARPSSVPAVPAVPEDLAGAVAMRASGLAPGPEHRALEPFVGRWSVTVEGPDGQPVGAGRARVEWIHGGLFQHWAMELELGGEPVAATSYLGYDGRDGRYQALWLSDLAAEMVLLSGTGDPNGAGLSLAGASEEAAGRRVMRFTGDDRFVVESRGPDADGRERLLRRSVYARAVDPTR